MKKVIYKQYGDENVLELTEQAMPAFDKDQLLIRVKAVSINPLDWRIYRGEMKLMSGSKFPKAIGIDFSGIVEKAGDTITNFKAGDAVFGLLDVFKCGALADYVVVKESDIATKPDNISFEQAAALPVTGMSALQIIDQLAAIGSGQEVLINGATGGIGMFAVQIAKRRGARVTAVVSTKGTKLATRWGADRLIDYSKEDIRLTDQRFDAVIDLSTRLTFEAAKKLMKSKATFVSTLPSPVALMYSFFNNLFSSRKMKILILKPNLSRLNTLSDLTRSGLEIFIDKVYAVTNVREAYSESSKGKIMGKSVITVN
jgi:NADPH:quinone reductase-like Zn-dependent oxidoreductase